MKIPYQHPSVSVSTMQSCFMLSTKKAKKNNGLSEKAVEHASVIMKNLIPTGKSWK
jgi:hypothetical protein